MTGTVVADTGPLIGFARVGALEMLKDLFEQIRIPKPVYLELQPGSKLPGARMIAAAVSEG